MGKDMLAIHIENRLHERQGKATNNVHTTLPPTDSDMIAQIFKDPGCPVGVPDDPVFAG